VIFALLLAGATLFGCTTLSTLDGATTLDPGEVQLAAAGSLQVGSNSVSSATWIPVPQADLAFRVGLRPNTDLGVRLYLGGVQGDLRYRFLQTRDWDFAVAPGVGGLALPIGGVLDVRAPLRAERGFGRDHRLSAGITPMGRTTFAALGTGSTGHTELYLGGFVRAQWTVGPVFLGTSLDLMGQPSRGLPPAVSLGVDLALRKGPFTRRGRK
jgi:hypothetical protein